MRPGILIRWLALLAAFLPAVAAQTPAAGGALRIGAIELSLGMPRKPALDALKRRFHVEHARSAADDWAVTAGGKTIAIVSFSEGKISRISKIWTTTREPGAVPLADQLYSLAGEFTAEGRTDCTLAAKPYKMSDVEGRIVTLACGNKSIQLTESRTPGSPWVTSLQEVLQ